MNWLLIMIAMLELVASIGKNADIVKVDVFDNVYLVSDNSLLKTSNDGKEYSYSTPNSESITQIDVTHIHKPLLYVEEKNQLRILDLDLIEINTIDLNNLDIEKGRIAVAASGKYWFYEIESNSLIELTESGRILQRIDYSHILNSKTECDFFVSGGRLYLLDEAGVHIFDRIGIYLRSIQIDASSAKIIGNSCYYSNKDGIFKLNLESEQSVSILDIEKVIDIEVEKGRLYVCIPGGINIYNLK